MAKQFADKIGIYAPYTWDDATYMAGALFDLSVKVFGLATTFLSMGPPDKGVHFLWDDQIRNGARVGFKSWAEECAHVVWFGLNPAKLEQAVSVGCKNTLVVLPHRITPADFPALDRFDRVLCPTKALYEGLKARIAHPHLQYVAWDSTLPISEKEGGRVAGKTRILLVLDSPTARAIGPLVLYTLRVVLDGNPDCTATILYGKNWPRHVLLALYELLDTHEQRVKAIKKPTHCQRLEEYRSTDWVFCPSVAENSGLVALEALACGAPVVSFAASPFDEILAPFHNACLAKCDVETSGTGVPHIKPNARELLDTLYDAVSNRSVLHMLRQRVWSELEERRRSFQAYWQRAWKGTAEEIVIE